MSAVVLTVAGLFVFPSVSFAANDLKARLDVLRPEATEVSALQRGIRRVDVALHGESVEITVATGTRI